MWASNFLLKPQDNWNSTIIFGHLLTQITQVFVKTQIEIENSDNRTLNESSNVGNTY